ncbi:MAG: hypothetical protein H5T99_04010, partial [Moorella sp. (in: Bacteria)]|nr:hypothetical protein [Moorella sp. (in: firmicutes)]
FNNAYTGESGTATFEVINATTQTIDDLKKALEKNTGEKVKLNLTQNGKAVDQSGWNPTLKTGVSIVTADYGPGVNLKISTRNAQGNPKDLALNTGPQGVNGTGDDINTLVSRINEHSLVTGVTAANVNNRLQLTTLGKGEKAVIRLSGSAVPLMGLPSSGTADVPASASATVNFALMDPEKSRDAAETLTLQGTLADGTPGVSRDFTIETPRPAVIDSVDLLGQKTIPAGGLATLASINSQFAANDKLVFNYKNSYTEQDISFTI